MNIFVHIRDKTYTVSVGSAQQTVESLENVALLRFDRFCWSIISALGVTKDLMINLEMTLKKSKQSLQFSFHRSISNIPFMIVLTKLWEF
jgi:hypothetical protein